MTDDRKMGAWVIAVLVFMGSALFAAGVAYDMGWNDGEMFGVAILVGVACSTLTYRLGTRQ